MTGLPDTAPRGAGEIHVQAALAAAHEVRTHLL
jgi:hypothetical protein